ncbi:hypothetical protein BEL04_06980 [Mucilaginibacter sp. PPCGB 2223]|uniref:hypothetical protein n=1 Tax=Mucilaginibacter sp. PPCGB 2223 TaxID=1886027 RepID=UPI0008269096|nr:hypothetical protein [Mucilaginibacter sp. PPCGB 2223]OCX54011.1 hypothetical protein BEL04_06980 [Mucilaginibacter sp. PPCGB 2223]
MKKILLAIDAERLNQKSVDFACYLAQLTGSPLAGMFLEDIRSKNVPGLKFAYGGVYVETIDTAMDTTSVQKIVNDNIAVFKTHCDSRMVAYDICHGYGEPIEQIVAESRFADLLILEPTCFSSSPLEKPSIFVKEALSRSECPVVISPYDFDEVNEIIFASDGDAPSVFAARQFTYLFPELRDKKVTVLQAGEQTNFKADGEEKLESYLKCHYGSVAAEKLPGKPEDKLFDYLLRKKDAFAVMGAYGRSKLSNMLKHSTAELLIEGNMLPIFIAHH